MTGPFSFRVGTTDGMARSALLLTPHGGVETPAFMPVGTKATVKGLSSEQLAAAGCQMVLANTYHLMLRPGERVIETLGGLHGFMNWPGPILTDSGGFQVFSLARINRVDDEGVRFANHLDGAPLTLTPRRAIEAQNALGADLIMVLDQCPPLPSPRPVIEEAARRTVNWARQCRQAHRRDDQALLAIVQGGTDVALRQQCARQLVELDFPGYAIGGLSVGEPHQQMLEVLAATVPLLPAERPRYLMGVGRPRDILAAIGLGVDLFDCVLPTRNGRNAYAFTRSGPLRLRNQKYRRDGRPLQEGCPCPACRAYSRAYLRHLFYAEEMLAPMLVSAHNVWFFQSMMAQARKAIGQQRFAAFAAELLAAVEPTEKSEQKA